MSRAEKIAAKMADGIMRESGTLSKSAGTRQQIISMISPVAEAIAVLDKSIDRRGRKLSDWAKTDSERLAVIEGNAGVGAHLHPESDIISDERVVKMRTDATVDRQLRSIDDALGGM